MKVTERRQRKIRIPLETMFGMLESILPADAELVKAEVDGDRWTLDLTINSQEYTVVPRGCAVPWYSNEP